MQRLNLIMSLRWLGIVALVSFLGIGITYLSLPKLDLHRYQNVSTIVQARDGELLNVFLSEDHSYRLDTRIEDVDPRYIDALLVLEDEWFWFHIGVNPLSLIRAAGQWALNGSIVSGGSTITMQLARLLEPKPRTLQNKWREIVRSIEIEIRFTKQEILQMYMTMLPMGGNLEGLRAASLKYWGKEPKNLSLSEIALLLSVPQSPESRRPDRQPDNALLSIKRVGKKLINAGLFPHSDYDELNSLPFVKLKPLPNVAWHYSKEVIARAKDKKHSLRIISSSLDYRIQQTVIQKATQFSKQLSADQNIAVMVTNGNTGEILAYLGSLGLNSNAGFMNLTRAVRSPGSTLKPFIYGMAFDDNLITSQTILHDTPKTYGSYAPSNFDKGHQGAVRAGVALQQSLNIPAVSVISDLGPNIFYNSWRKAGLMLKLPRGANANVGIALGAVGTRLQDLVQGYGALANSGRVMPLSYEKLVISSKIHSLSPSLLTKSSADEITNILASAEGIEGRVTRAYTQGGSQASFKTGTSYGYRDSWAIGVKGLYVIGVWVGRPDGTPVTGQTGRSVALRLANDIADKLRSDRAIKLWYPEPLSITEIEKPPVRLIYPTNGINIISTKPPNINRKFKINLSGSGDKLTIYLNEKLVKSNDIAQSKIPVPHDGTYQLKVFDEGILTDTVTFTIVSKSL